MISWSPLVFHRVVALRFVDFSSVALRSDVQTCAFQSVRMCSISTLAIRCVSLSLSLSLSFSLCFCSILLAS